MNNGCIIFLPKIYGESGASHLLKAKAPDYRRSGPAHLLTVLADHAQATISK
jgi:hypothetical protein